MIFVTLGTHESPFSRLIGALEGLPRDEQLVVQHGSSPPGPAWATCVDFMPFDEIAAHIREARAVVAHAGVGSIMTALASEKRPLVMARLRRFGEHVAVHQLSLARRLDAIGLVKLVEEPEELPRAVARDVAAPSRLLPAHRLSDELRSYLAAEIGTVPRAHVAHV